MADEEIGELLKILELYALKKVPRDNSNRYDDEKAGVRVVRKETTAEHVYSSLRLADFFLTQEPEFAGVDRLRTYEMLLYHDDVEIVARDTGISDLPGRRTKDVRERAALEVLARSLPRGLEGKLLAFDAEYRAQETDVARFASAVNKMDALVHELQYPADWGPKGFDERSVRAWFGPSFAHSPTFTRYFEAIVQHCARGGYFKAD